MAAWNVTPVYYEVPLFILCVGIQRANELLVIRIMNFFLLLLIRPKAKEESVTYFNDDK